MRIKTFEASTLQEALCLAKDELGDEAVVLNTKHVRAAGLRGLRGETKIELMAAVDENVPLAASSVSVMEPPPKPAPPAPIAARLYADHSRRESHAGADLEEIRSQLDRLTSAVQGLLSPAEPQYSGSSLLDLGVDEDLAQNLLPELAGIDDAYALTSALAGRMQAFAAPPALDARQVIALVGPTGVGKTTTLAKLAARFSLEQGKKVALLTADTFRIGAVQQLKTYARIMDVPLEIALTPEEVSEGVMKHQDKDVILIDTVGRSQRSDEHLSELKSFVDAAEPTETYLLIAASLDKAVQGEVVERFALLSPTRLVITKLDECATRGCLVNLPLRTGLPISCITAGQNVPQDIEYAHAGQIARLVTGVA